MTKYEAEQVARYAVRAAREGAHWGEYALRRYLEKRNVPMELYWLAVFLEAA